MKIEIEKKVKIELDLEEANKLISILKRTIIHSSNNSLSTFAVQLKQELER